MTRLVRALRRRIFGISPEEVSFALRGFHSNSQVAREQLEGIGRVFLTGYHAALEAEDPLTLASSLETVEPERRGFACEGAAMALSLMDQLFPARRNRVAAFLDAYGAPHVYMVYVGTGWALARLKRRPLRRLSQLDPVLRWLAVDGYGFHEGYFSPRRTVTARKIPQRLQGYERRAFDQGLGRSIWFVDGADIARIPATLAAFSKQRQGDLWSGIGLAAAYAGGTDADGLLALCASAGEFRPALAQGVAFAAKARSRARNPAPHTALACDLVCGLSIEEAARITDVALEDLPRDAFTPAFEVWRQRIQGHFATTTVKV